MTVSRKQPKAKEPVKIRFKQLSGGSQSIYFDIYRNGKRMYEFPKLYLVPERTAEDRELNRRMLDKAIRIKAQRIDELSSRENGFVNMGLKQKANFISYLQALTKRKEAEGKSSVCDTYRSLIRHLVCYKGEGVTFKQITREYCCGFNEYLQTAENLSSRRGLAANAKGSLLSKGSRYSYSRALSIILNCAVQDGILADNPMKKLTRFERPKRPESDREYLGLEEIRTLVKTECVKPLVKSAFLFSCFSGLRFSDVKALRWDDIQTDHEGRKQICFTQKKTKKKEYLQVSDEALKFLPERGTATGEDIIFPLSSSGFTNQALKSWVLASGIKKRVTFHVARHTNATLLLSLGVPIETVSKLLGHADMKTTQIYAKVIDKNKREAVSKLDGLTD
ncbi:MAG: site-specific integrase [Prevotella sp.]|jgi:integrase|nr:site-specific integrase [Prevotella sp.]